MLSRFAIRYKALIDKLLEIYNCCFIPEIFPECWKEAVRINILKPNKPDNYPASYRPIALLKILRKIVEF